MLANNKTILITGASGGIGKVLATHFYAKGYNLALQYFNTAVNIKNITGSSGSDKIFTYKANIRNEEEVKNMVGAVNQTFGPVDILINNAGVAKSGMSWKLSLADWQAVIDTNLTGTFLTTKYCIPFMRQKQWGRIITIGSVIGSTGVAGLSPYAASKSALTGYVKSVAREVADKNITVNNIAAGYMDGGMAFEIPEQIREKTIQEIPMKKFGPVNEIATLIEYIISDNASYLTGQTIGLNGGMD